MKINNAILAAPRREYPINRAVLARRTAPLGPVDMFEPAVQPMVKPVAAQSIQQASTGGFFSNLWNSVKGAVSGLLGKASSWLSSNVGGLIDKAKTWAGDFLEGIMRKASTWLETILARWQGKIQS